LNLRELLHLAKPSLDLPDTALAIEARVRGTAAAPVVEATLDGHSERSERLGLNRIHYRVSASYADERARAQWTLSALGESFHGKADVPTVASGNRPLSVEMVASNIKMAQLRKVLPPALARVDGRLDGSVRASGTTQRPLVSVFVHGRGWQLDGDAKNNDVQLKVDYGNQRLNARADVHLQQVLGKDAGALTAQLELPIDLSLAKVQKTRRFMAQLEHRTPIAAVVTLAHVDLGRFPFAPLGVKAPLDAGVVDGSVKLRGTLHQPLLDVDLEGRDLRKGQVNKVDVYASVDYADKRARGRVDASLRGAPLLRVRGEAPIDFQRVIDGQPYLATPLRVDAEVAGFNLARVQDLVPGIAGQLHARAEVRGTLGRPTGKLDAGVAGLSLGQTRYETLEAHGDFDGATLSAKLAAREVAGGTLSADARWPADPQAPVVAQLRAKGFRIDVALATLTNPRVVKGTLDASLDLRGPRSGPTIEGFLRLHDGELALAADPRLYQGVTIDVAVHDGALTVHEAAARVGDGSISARGSARLAGLQPQSVDLRAEAKKLPIPTGTFGAWVDAIVSLHGRRTAQGMSGTLTLEQGTANLPKLAGGRKLQKTGPLADVKFVDAQARREEEKRKEAERETAEIALVAHIPGPFHVRSKEMWTDLKGELQVAIAGPVARISGHAEAVGGWFELLGRRYSIERARVGFGGEAEPNPELDVRLTRELSETRLVIEVHGTAKKPELVLASEPPIYDQSQVIAAILSGDPASRRVDARSLESKVTGAISGILVGKIKDQIAPNLPIDVIRVGAAEGATGMADSRIEVGKYITDNIYVSYVHQFGSTYLGTQRFNANEANLEWRFKKRYEVEAAFGDAAVGRLNFFWTIRY